MELSVDLKKKKKKKTKKDRAQFTNLDLNNAISEFQPLLPKVYVLNCVREITFSHL